jgi:GNAT superfamily N-acetyltransferase
MSPIIRIARSSDAEAIASLVRIYWEFEKIEGFDSSRTICLITQILAHANLGTFWVAEIDGNLEAYLLVVHVFSLEHGGIMGEIDEFFVAPESRSTQIGGALLNKAIQSLAQEGVAQLQLQLGVNNLRAKKFYEQHGFRQLAGYTLLHKPLKSI